MKLLNLQTKNKISQPEEQIFFAGGKLCIFCDGQDTGIQDILLQYVVCNKRVHFNVRLLLLLAPAHISGAGHSSWYCGVTVII